MGLWKGTKKVVGHMVDVRVDRWIDLTSLQNSTRYFWDRTKSLFSIQTAEHPESFEEAVDRMGLSPETVTKQSERFLRLSLFFVLMTTALLIYTIILYHLKNWTGMGICTSLSLYALSLAFRFHFWHFQISQKKLGCHVWEWCRLILPQKRKNLL